MGRVNRAASGPIGGRLRMNNVLRTLIKKRRPVIKKIVIGSYYITIFEWEIRGRRTAKFFPYERTRFIGGWNTGKEGRSRHENCGNISEGISRFSVAKFPLTA